MKQNHEGKVNKFVRPYQICTNCVMDTSDSKIVFNEKGMCDFCVDFYENIQPNWKTGEEGMNELHKVAAEIKRDSKGKSTTASLV